MQELIPFDYDLIKQGYKVVTRDGRDVSQITLFELGVGKKLVGVVSDRFESFEFNGVYSPNGRALTALDLFMVPHTTVKYINIYTEDPAPDLFIFDNPTPLKSYDNKSAFSIKVTYVEDKPISVELI